jgi:hypothetical protein
MFHMRSAFRRQSKSNRKNTGKIALFAVLLLLLSGAVLSGCSSRPGASAAGDSPAVAPATGREQGTSDSSIQEKVTLWVTRDFGRQVLHDETVPFKQGAAVMDLLKQIATVETAYGGGFVNSIDGLASGFTGKNWKERSKQDWFYTVNGTPAEVGSLDYLPRAGDIIWWDYHSWQSGGSGAYAAGVWPANVKAWAEQNGKLRISASDAMIEQTLRRQLLSDAAGVTGEVWQNNPAEYKPDDTFTVLAATWDEVKQNPFLQGLNDHAAQAGLAFHWTDSGLEVADEAGKAGQPLASAGIIAAVDGGRGAPVMLILATDPEALARTVDVFKTPEQWQHTYAVLVTQREIGPLPLQAEEQ